MEELIKIKHSRAKMFALAAAGKLVDSDTGEIVSLGEGDSHVVGKERSSRTGYSKCFKTEHKATVMEECKGYAKYLFVITDYLDNDNVFNQTAFRNDMAMEYLPFYRMRTAFVSAGIMLDDRGELLVNPLFVSVGPYVPKRAVELFKYVNAEKFMVNYYSLN